jgi:23S rRNA (guanine745-N1)-methyltransferase
VGAPRPRPRRLGGRPGSRPGGAAGAGDRSEEQGRAAGAPLTLLICPVRDCGEPLERWERALICPRGHSFDLARSGYANLLQPQDRRSKVPGDSLAAVEARRRLLDAGYGAPLLRALREEIEPLGLPAGTAVLDVGCGEGYYLSSIARERSVEAHGVDLSAAAVDLAARRYPGAAWIVANADRSLPYAAGSFDLILSIDARLHPAEMRRVLKEGGRLLVAVPGPDDLVELRAAVLGEGRLRDRLEGASGRLAEYFEIEARRTVRDAVRLGPAEVRDALAATYRLRDSRRPAIAGIEVTLSHQLARFRPLPPGTVGSSLSATP